MKQFQPDKRIKCLPDIRYVYTSALSETSKHNHSDFELSIQHNEPNKLPNPMEYQTADKLNSSANSHTTELEILWCEQLLR